MPIRLALRSLVFCLPLLLVGGISAQRSTAISPARASAAREAAPEEDYGIVANEDGDAWGGDNAAQGFRADFSSGGLQVSGTGIDGAPWSLGLRLVSWGRGDVLQPVQEGSIEAAGRRIEIHHGNLTEWYVNDERGVEQGFTVHEPPTAATSEPLVLVLKVEGGCQASVKSGGRDAVFRFPEQDITIHYSGLSAWDARGKNLDADLAVDQLGRVLLVRVDDHSARYPLTIDPWVWTEVGAWWPSDIPWYGGAGQAVAMDETKALVGAPGFGLHLAEGAAYAYEHLGSTWVERGKLVASNGQLRHRFGSAVAIEGDSAVIGAPGFGYADQGAAYIFVHNGATWVEQIMLRVSPRQPHDLFGGAVDFDGDTVLIGASGVDGDGGENEGAAYVFVGSGTSWTEQAKLDSTAGGQKLVGDDVALEGDTALLGARDAAYVFVRSGTSWTEQAVLPACCSQYGTRVALSGDTALIGAAGRNKVYVYVRSGSQWILQATLERPDGGGHSWFGKSVALQGDRALIGGERYRQVGEAIMYERSGGSWSIEALIQPPPPPGKSYWFADSIEFDGDRALIGDPGAYRVYGDWTGAAFLYWLWPDASATSRSAGANPNSLSATTPPVLGTTYSATVQLAGTTGHDFAWLMGYVEPLTWTMGGGQVLLVDITHPLGELLDFTFAGGPVATFDKAIPNLVGLAGFELSTQALHIGGVQPFALSNAQDLFLGY